MSCEVGGRPTHQETQMHFQKHLTPQAHLFPHPTPQVHYEFAKGSGSILRRQMAAADYSLEISRHALSEASGVAAPLHFHFLTACSLLVPGPRNPSLSCMNPSITRIPLVPAPVDRAGLCVSVASERPPTEQQGARLWR